ncbi:hypothetical protein GPECTOR_260g661 [Gonium pectorale]|uniref:Uncharacterized protein n=1 Tax=Gonium pectorale TaxID=33097 RepID=A0A150FWB0_GONPE|nr:hypothetical protein GPECTOR_260g661 [Gonium pectorale]|eukprot:KXZ41858.1 hypothetical protein GPECTOR_260g661 [Gonium pectorale]
MPLNLTSFATAGAGATSAKQRPSKDRHGRDAVVLKDVVVRPASSAERAAVAAVAPHVPAENARTVVFDDDSDIHLADLRPFALNKYTQLTAVTTFEDAKKTRPGEALQGPLLLLVVGPANTSGKGHAINGGQAYALKALTVTEAGAIKAVELLVWSSYAHATSVGPAIETSLQDRVPVVMTGFARDQRCPAAQGTNGTALIRLAPTRNAAAFMPPTSAPMTALAQAMSDAAARLHRVTAAAAPAAPSSAGSGASPRSSPTAAAMGATATAVRAGPSTSVPMDLSSAGQCVLAFSPYGMIVEGTLSAKGLVVTPDAPIEASMTKLDNNGDVIGHSVALITSTKVVEDVFCASKPFLAYLSEECHGDIYNFAAKVEEGVQLFVRTGPSGIVLKYGRSPDALLPSAAAATVVDADAGIEDTAAAAITSFFDSAATAAHERQASGVMLPQKRAGTASPTLSDDGAGAHSPRSTGNGGNDGINAATSATTAAVGASASSAAKPSPAKRAAGFSFRDAVATSAKAATAAAATARFTATTDHVLTVATVNAATAATSQAKANAATSGGNPPPCTPTQASARAASSFAAAPHAASATTTTVAATAGNTTPMSMPAAPPRMAPAPTTNVAQNLANDNGADAHMHNSPTSPATSEVSMDVNADPAMGIDDDDAEYDMEA